MEYIQEVEDSAAPKNKILCCECGVLIDPNGSNMCVACLRSRFDITEGIPKQAVLYHCRGCERYLQPPSEWIRAALETKELLALCLKKLKGLNRLKLIDASFIWTEPHSKRIKVKLTVQGTIEAGVDLKQTFIVEYTVNHHMCDECHRSEAQDYWRALVQVRQKTENRKTIYYLEQLILKHKLHQSTLGIKPISEGLDFFYTTEAQARKFVDFVNTVLPVKYQHSKKLLSHDIHSNIYNYKFSYSVEIVPVSKDNIVCLPKKLTQQLAGLSPVCLVYRVTSGLHLIDPCTAQIAEISSTLYWRYPFHSICSPKQLVEYTVIDIEPIMDKDRRYFPGQGALSSKHVLADCWVVRTCDLGLVENTIHTKTHLGHVLKIGDSVMGYNIIDSNINDPNFDKLDSSKVPDVILVKKHYGDASLRNKQRIWKLKHLTNENEALHINDKDYNEFLDDLEEDVDLRQNVNIFKDRSKVIPVDSNDVNEETIPHVTLEEMLDDLVIEDVEMEEQ